MIRLLRAHARRGAFLVAALVVLVGIARSGAMYFYCPAMGAVLEASCCGEHHASPQTEIAAPECCRAHRLGSLPSANAAPARGVVVAAPLLALVPAVATDLDVRAPVASLLVEHDARAGPSPPAARRAELMIWTC